jgi:hypothetical protein
MRVPRRCWPQRVSPLRETRAPCLSLLGDLSTHLGRVLVCVEANEQVHDTIRRFQDSFHRGRLQLGRVERALVVTARSRVSAHASTRWLIGERCPSASDKTRKADCEPWLARYGDLAASTVNSRVSAVSKFFQTDPCMTA